MKYTEEHEWLKVEGDIVVVGITEHAATQLGDVVFVELPDAGIAVAKDDEIIVIESVKAASTFLHRSMARSSRSTRRWPTIRGS